jgi:hypothetical protein
VRYSKGGKVLLTMLSKISTDEKDLTVNVKGTDAQGKPVDAHRDDAHRAVRIVETE